MSDEVIDTVRLVGQQRSEERFRVLERAGEGGMGLVFRARCVTDDTLVALKVMNVATGNAARFALEASVLAKLEHENIVRYHSHGFTSDEKPYLAMEWLEGETLGEVLARGPMKADEVVRIGRAIAAALEYAHANGVVHRDLKPSNVVLTHDGAVKLLDFGVARIADLGRGLTQTGEVIGTPGYLAPEQARGEEAIDGRADLFALGVVLYRALSGRLPFEAKDTVAYLAKLMFEDPPPLAPLAPGAPPGLVDLVMRLIARAPADRPGKAADVLEALSRDLDVVASRPKQETRGDDRTLASPGTTGATMTAPSRSRPTWIVLALLVALASAALWIGLTHRTDEVRPNAVPTASSSAAAIDASTATLTRACREWSGAIARAQRADGSFSGEQHRPSSGWDTAQQLFALARANHACGAPGQTVLYGGVQALDGFRTDAGWTGMRSRSEVPVAAWSLLAAAALARDGVDPGGAAGAGGPLAAAATDAGFSFLPGHAHADAKAALYTTVIGTWAVVEGSLDPAIAPTARDAAHVLDGALRSDATLRSTGGLEEQATWILLRARARGLVTPDAALLEGLATDIVTRCALEGDHCTRPLSQDDTMRISTDIDAGPEELIHLWHPWLTLVAHVLATDRSIALSEKTRAAIDLLARWSMTELVSSVSVVGVAAEYKIAEYLIVVTLLLE